MRQHASHADDLREDLARVQADIEQAENADPIVDQDSYHDYLESLWAEEAELAALIEQEGDKP